jgi:hypothetical protein
MQFLAEQELHKQIAYVAQDLIGSPIIKTDSIEEKDIENAREVEHKFVKAADGSWVVNLFKAAWGHFVRIDPPKGSTVKQSFYIPVNK